MSNKKYNNKIRVTSHVSRDFLQNSVYFNTLPKVIWEYVSNSLDATDDGVPAMIDVNISKKRIIISDTGSGMSRSELENFFKMHGQNQQRKRGKRVRGRFGTGKSAAFGIADCLEIDTVQSGLRNVVKLHRKDILAASDGSSFPVEDIIIEEPTDEINGTKIVITELNNAGRIKISKVIEFLERHLSRYRRKSVVTVNDHICKYEELPYIEIYHRHASDFLRDQIGEVTLTIKESPVPLSDDINGIDIFSHGIWHETTLAGIENKEKSQLIFGYVDVPALEDNDWKIPPFDNTRNNTLNRQNPVVVMLLGWIAEEVDLIRKDIVEKHRQRRKSEQAKQLEKEAERLADLLNDDFAQLEFEMERARSVQNRRGQKSVDEDADFDGSLSPGKGELTVDLEQTGSSNSDGNRSDVGADGNQSRPGPGIQKGNSKGDKTTISEGQRKRRKAVFSIEYENISPQQPRSRYDAKDKTIYINLDHPQIGNILTDSGNNIESKQFREICYEVATVEYAIALEYERIGNESVLDPNDALYDVRETINRVTRRFVGVLKDL